MTTFVSRPITKPDHFKLVFTRNNGYIWYAVLISMIQSIERYTSLAKHSCSSRHVAIISKYIL